MKITELLSSSEAVDALEIVLRVVDSAEVDAAIVEVLAARDAVAP